MILELAEGPRRKSKYITVDAYKRKTSVSAHKRRRPVLNSGDYHVYVPHHLSEAGTGLWVREDKFDGLSDNDWHTLMDELLEHDPELSELSFGGKWKAKRAEKKKVKAAKKKEKWDRRQKRKDLKAASKAQKRLMKGQKGGGSDADGEGGSSGGGSILDTIINKGTEIVDRVKSGAGGGSTAPQDSDEPEGAGGEDTQGAPVKKSGGINILGMEVSTPMAIGGGLGIAALLYLVLKKKK